MRTLLAAALEWRTLIWLGAGIAAAAATSNPFPVVVALGVYLWSVQRLAASEPFQRAAEEARRRAELTARYRELDEMARTVLRTLSLNRSWFVRALEGLTQQRIMTRSWYDRATDVFQSARQIYEEWRSRPEEHAGKIDLVKQAVQLAYLYLKILRSYHTITANRPRKNLAEIEARLARNQKRLSDIDDLEARRHLQRAIEMDLQVLEQEGEEEAEQERYNAKLTAIESSLDLLRRQIFSPEATGDAERLQEMLLEAEAMDEALGEVRQRTRVKVR